MTDPGPFLGALAGVLGMADTVPYVRDTLARSTRPHRGTWLIWSVVAVVALGSQQADGAVWSLVPLGVQAVGCCVVLVLSVRWGTGGLSPVELALVAVAGVGVVGWVVAGEPVVATCCAILADLVAAALMVPKTWADPHSETASTFVLAALGGALTAGAVGAWTLPLLLYPAYFFVVNGLLAVVILARRRHAPAPVPLVVRPPERVPVG